MLGEITHMQIGIQATLFFLPQNPVRLHTGHTIAAGPVQLSGSRLPIQCSPTELTSSLGHLSVHLATGLLGYNTFHGFGVLRSLHLLYTRALRA